MQDLDTAQCLQSVWTQSERRNLQQQFGLSTIPLLCSICNILHYTSFFPTCFGVHASKISVLKYTPWIFLPSCHSWKLTAVPSCLHFNSKNNPQMPLCPPTSWPASPKHPYSRAKGVLAVLSVLCVLLSLGPLVHESDGGQSEMRSVLLFSVKWLERRGGRGGY